MQPCHNARRLYLFALVVVLCSTTYAAAQPGTLDLTFANNGIFAAPGTLRGAQGGAIQSDGNIVVAGSGAFNQTSADTLIRLTPAGVLDQSFGSGGVVTITNPGGSVYYVDGFFALAIQSNGKIVAAGAAQLESGSVIVQVARFQTNGSLDPSFGSGGFTTTTAITTTPYNSSASRNVALALQPNGEILVAAGYSNLMARFTSSGQLDTTFGSGGIVNLANAGASFSTAPTQIAVQKNGKILVASGSLAPTPQLQAGTISRYNSNGSLDATFGASGTAASVGSASALLLQSDGKIVVAGALTSKINAAPAANDVGFGIIRYTSSGSIDKTFGSGGVAIADFGANAPLSGAFALAIQSNGDIVAAGAAAQGAANLSFDSAFGLARFTSTGQLDSSFGSGGLVTTTILSGSSNVYSDVTGLAIQSDGKIVAAGNTAVDQGFGSGTGAYVARYLAQ
jgi:uncharacterized delta-60 repeat protein